MQTKSPLSVINAIYYSVDGTFSQRMGRMINDGIGEDQNAEMRRLYIDEHPYLAVFATRDILPGEEIRYDYGIKTLPWRQAMKKEKKKGK